MEYLGTIYKGSQSDIIFPVPFIELSDGATVDFYTDGDGVFSRTKDEIKIDNYMLRTTASADELNSLNDGVLNYTINTCMGKSEGDTGLYLSEPTSYVDKQYLTADGVKTINGESIVGQGNIEIQGGGGSNDYIWEWIYTPYYTGNTNFSEEELQSVIDAHNNGKNIIIKYNNLFIYPSTFEVAKTVLLIEYIYNGDTYIFEYNSDGQSQNISKKDTSDTYVVSLDGENSLNNLTLTKDEIINLMAAVQENKNIILKNNEITFHVIKTNISNNIFQIFYGFTGFSYFRWTVSLNNYEVDVNSQKTVAYSFQSQINSASYLNLRDISLKNNASVDTILTKLKKDIFITGFDLSKGGINSTYTVDGNFDEIKSYFTTHQIKGIDTTGEIFNLDFRLKTDGTLAASYIHRDMLSNIDNKIYTFILSRNSDDNSKINVQNYITSFDDIYNEINKTSDIVYGFDKRIYAIEDELNTLSGSVVDNYYTKTEVDGKIPTSTSQLTNDSGYLTEHQSLTEYYTKSQCDANYETKGYSYSKSESDTNYASKTNTYTKEETYSKSEIDTKIGDINNILESI